MGLEVVEVPWVLANPNPHGHLDKNLDRGLSSPSSKT